MPEAGADPVELPALSRAGAGGELTGPLAGILAGPAPQAPPRRSDLGRNLLATLGLAVVFGVAAQIIELRPLELLRDVGNIGVFLKGYLQPVVRPRRASTPGSAW